MGFVVNDNVVDTNCYFLDIHHMGGIEQLHAKRVTPRYTGTVSKHAKLYAHGGMVRKTSVQPFYVPALFCPGQELARPSSVPASVTPLPFNLDVGQIITNDAV